MTDSPTISSTDSDLYRRLIDCVRDYAILALDADGKSSCGMQVRSGLPSSRPMRRLAGRSRASLGRRIERAGRPSRSCQPRFATVAPTMRSGSRAKMARRFARTSRSRRFAIPSERLSGFTVVIRDLTERRLADEALQESEQRFRLIVQSIKDYGIFMLDPLGRIVSWNPGAERLKGYTADEIIGKHFSIFYPQEDLDSRKPERELEVASKVGRFEDEGWRLRKDGSRFWANVIITALRQRVGGARRIREGHAGPHRASRRADSGARRHAPRHRGGHGQSREERVPHGDVARVADTAQRHRRLRRAAVARARRWSHRPPARVSRIAFAAARSI